MTRDRPLLVIEAGRAERRYWRDLWSYRELFATLAWRDIAVRYKQTAIGIAWAVLRPGLTMLVFVAFRRIMQVPPGEVPEAVGVLAAVLPWQLFSAGLSDASGSLVANANLISKVYFPRMIVPFVSVITSVVDFGVTLALLAILMAWYGVAPGWQLVTLPFFVLLAFAATTGAGLLLAALTVEYRDFRYVVPFIAQFGLFVSPIAFSTADVPAQWRAVYSLNPMVGVIDGFRWALFGDRAPVDGWTVAASAAISCLLLAVGMRHFRRVERRFADVI